LARLEVSALQKLHREAKLLLKAMRRSATLSDVAAVQTITAPPAADVRAARPSRGWRRSLPWRKREHAPVRYPYGEASHGWGTRLHDTIESMPDSRSSAASLARLNAYRRSRAEQRAEESEAREYHGRVRYRGADEPPEWYWPDDPA
jgi:hypothetical protein